MLGHKKKILIWPPKRTFHQCCVSLRTAHLKHAAAAGVAQCLMGPSRYLRVTGSTLTVAIPAMWNCFLPPQKNLGLLPISGIVSGIGGQKKIPVVCSNLPDSYTNKCLCVHLCVRTIGMLGFGTEHLCLFSIQTHKTQRCLGAARFMSCEQSLCEWSANQSSALLAIPLLSLQRLLHSHAQTASHHTHMSHHTSRFQWNNAHPNTK